LVPWYYAVVEREHDIQNPTSPEKIRLLGERMRLRPGARVLDVASGRGGPAVLLADAFALYFKTKNFHWHVSGRHFRDYHLMLDEQSDAIFATTDELAERVRKIGGITLRSIGQVAKLQTVKDNNDDYVPPREMLRELMEDNKQMAAAMRKARKVADDYEDVGTTSLLETFIDQTERRTWFLFEASREEGGNAA